MTIHPTAIIHPKANLDDTIEVGPNCVIDKDVSIAAGCRLYQGVYVTGWTHIGENCVLHPGVIVGHEPQDTKYGGERSYCRVGRNNILREYVTVHRGTTPESETVIGDDCYLLGFSHVAHNCLIGDRVTLIHGALLGGHVEVENGATVGGAAVVHQFVRIGELAMIAGNARAIMDVIPFALTDVEGRVAGLNRIGLRRARLSCGDIEQIRAVYRAWYAGEAALAEAIDRMTSGPASGPRDRLIRFLCDDSRRGIAGRTRGRSRTSRDRVADDAD